MSDGQHNGVAGFSFCFVAGVAALVYGCEQDAWPMIVCGLVLMFLCPIAFAAEVIEKKIRRK